MRFDRLFFTVIAVPLDFLAVVAGGVAAWRLRFSPELQGLREVQFLIPFSEFLWLVMLSGFITIVAIAWIGLYRFPKPEYGPFGVTFRLWLATTITLAVIALAMFLNQELFGSRFLVLVGWLLASVFLMASRTTLYWFEQLLARHFHVGLRRALVIGNDDLSNRFVEELAREPAFGIRVVHRSMEASVNELADAITRLGVDAVVIADPNQSRETLREVIDTANAEHVDILLVPNILQTLTANASASVLAGIPVIELKRTRLEGWGRVTKRILDFTGALLLIVLTSPVMLLTAVAILLDSGRPVLFRELDNGEPLMRIGKSGKPFRYFKFRSMRNGVHALRYRELAGKNIRQDGPLVKIPNDPRVTRVGHVIRKYSIDELPEFFLVLAGKMSLVGPRPHLPEEVQKYQRHHRRVLAIKPGITGMAQISGRSDLTFEDEVRIDTHYIEHWSLWLDLKIILLTPFVILFKRHRE